MGNIMEEAFTAYTGSEKVFTLNGKELVIPARFDAFITYRTKFMKLAKACADKAAEEYKEKIHDLDTFRALFQDIYLENLKIVSSKAVDILVSEGIYQFSIDTFSAKNIETFHTALNDLRTTNESVKLTEQNNAKVTQNLKNGIGSLFSNRGSFARGLGPARRRSGKRCGCSGKTAAPGGRTSGYPAAIPSVRSQCAQQTATAFLCPASQCVYSAVQGRKNADNPPLRFLFCPVPMLSEVFEVPRPQFEAATPYRIAGHPPVVPPHCPCRAL